MPSLLILILAIAVLYIFSRLFIQKLFIVLYRFTKDRDKASLFLGLIFLPGTFVHEISHFITALFLLVPVGELNLIPELQEEGLKLGSVKIGQTDFVRGSLIGLAPLLVGFGILFYAISFTLMPGNLNNPWIIALMLYLVFEITHTMFSSREDLRAVLELVVFIAVVAATLYFLKIFTPFIYIYGKILEVDPFLQKLSYFLFIPIAIELAFLGLFRRVRI